jgi:hypothetical protein
MNKHFIDEYITGNLDAIKELIKIYHNDIDLYDIIEWGFCLACKYGHLNIVKYLIDIYKTPYNENKYYNKINIHYKDEYGFQLACRSGQINIVEYLVNLYKTNKDYNKIDIHKNDELGFRWAYENKHKHIVKYLIGLYKTQHNQNKVYDTINIYSFFDLEYIVPRNILSKYISSCGYCTLIDNNCMILL